MQVGMIGLGRMGGNMARRLMRAGHECVVYDLSQESVKRLEADGAVGSVSIDDFVSKLKKPKVVWLMVPAGAPTESAVTSIAQRAGGETIIIDGGNSYFKDDIRRARELAAKGIHYVDVGTSGGIWGLERGYCLMVGGERSVFSMIEPILETLAPGTADVAPNPGRSEATGPADRGYLYCGPPGAGHFVKMIHNGIEYGLMQAYAEGFDILKNANAGEVAKDYAYDFDIAEIAEVWRRGSVIGLVAPGSDGRGSRRESVALELLGIRPGLR
jgi:6-phosphogluconate dehydrogenase